MNFKKKGENNRDLKFMLKNYSAYIILVIITIVYFGFGVSKHSKIMNRENKVALIIGNSKYTNIPSITSALENSEDMASVLKKLGFDVTVVKNGTLDEMKIGLANFIEKIKNGGTGVVLYSGYGIQINGENYLVPVDLKYEMSEEEIKEKSFNANLIVSAVEKIKNSKNIIILDACRNNPFKNSKNIGLTEMKAPIGNIIMFPTQTNMASLDGVERNSSFIKFLQNNIQIQGMELSDVIENTRKELYTETNGIQLLWTNGKFLKPFYFTGGKENIKNSKITTEMKQENKSINMNSRNNSNVGLIGYWNFDTGNVTDNSGKGNNGIMYGGISFVDGVKGKAAKFDGRTGYMEIQNHLVKLKGDNFTISAWFNFEGDNKGGYNQILMLGYENQAEVTDCELVFSEEKLMVYLRDRYSEIVRYQHSENINNKWNNIIIRREKNDFTVYLNSIKIYQIRKKLGEIDSENAPIIIGNGNSNCNNRYFRGLIDEVRIYNRAISEDEIKGLYELEFVK